MKETSAGAAAGMAQTYRIALEACDAGTHRMTNASVPFAGERTHYAPEAHAARDSCSSESPRRAAPCRCRLATLYENARGSSIDSTSERCATACPDLGVTADEVPPSAVESVAGSFTAGRLSASVDACGGADGCHAGGRDFLQVAGRAQRRHRDRDSPFLSRGRASEFETALRQPPPLALKTGARRLSGEHEASGCNE